MHLVTTLENASNTKATRPYIRQDYYPLVVNKYVTFQPYSKYQSKNYPFWGDVLKMVGSILNKAGIAVVQLGGEGEKKFDGVYSCIGKTSYNQTAYIIQNGLGHIGADSFMAHVAGALNKPCVVVYGNNLIENVIPYWNKEIYSYSAYDKWMPCFSEHDPNNFIYNIKPDDIAEGICKMLGLDFDFQLRTVWTGSECAVTRYDLVPNQVVSPKTFGVNGYVIRMDYEHNEKNLASQLIQCPCSIVANKPIELDLVDYKNHIAEINYEITCKEDAEFVRYLHLSGFKYFLFTYLSEDKLNDLKLDFIDYNPIILQKLHDISFLDKYSINDLFFESKRFILSNQKIYLTESTMMLDKPVPNIHNLQQFDSLYIRESLRKDIQFLRFYERRN